MPSAPLGTSFRELNPERRIGWTGVFLWVGHQTGEPTVLAQFQIGHVAQFVAELLYIFRVGLNHCAPPKEREDRIERTGSQFSGAVSKVAGKYAVRQTESKTGHRGLVSFGLPERKSAKPKSHTVACKLCLAFDRTVAYGQLAFYRPTSCQRCLML